MIVLNTFQGKLMKKILVLLATLGAISGAVQAQEQIKVLSTQELVNTCKLPASPESRSFCIGYTSAIYDTYLATRHPQRVGENPQTADKPAAGTALGYLAMRFPCGKK
jgi:disulfide bond formation protein DsbB